MKKQFDKLKHIYYSNDQLRYKYKITEEDFNKIYSSEENKLVALTNTNNTSLYLEMDYVDLLGLKYREVYSRYSHYFDEEDYVISEIKGSLSTEGVHSSRKRIKAVALSEQSTNEEEQNIINLYKCIQIIKDLDITKENIKLVYDTLTYNIDLKENTLDGEYYREDEVEIGNVARGVSSLKVADMMDELLEFCDALINIDVDTDTMMTIALMYVNIIHYQFVYIHPYYDRNGRMARLLAQWVSFKINVKAKHIAVSEAISYDKSNYYSAIQEVRDSYGSRDVTHFVDYMLKAQIRYMETYLLVDKIRFDLQDNLTVLSSSELSYIKMLYLSNLRDKKFGYKDFLKLLVINDEVKSKQAIFKILNILNDKGVLDSAIASDNKTRFYWLVAKKS